MTRFSLQHASTATRFLCGLCCLALAGLVAACSDNNTPPKPKPKPFEGTELDRVASAIYYGTRSGTTRANFYLQLANAECTEDEYGYLSPTGEGTLLLLDLWALHASGESIALPTGEYTVVDSQDDKTLDPTTTCFKKGTGADVETTFLSSGKVEVTCEGEIYTITALLSDGTTEHAFTYTGAIEWTNRENGNDHPITQNVKTTFIGGNGVYYGDRNKNGLGFFEMALYDVPLEGPFLSGEGHMLVMQLYTPLQDDGAEQIFLPEGTYTPMEGDASEFRFVVGAMRLDEDHFVPTGSVAEYDDASGSPYYGLIGGGEMTVRRTGDSYTITCNLGMEQVLTFEADYTGAIPFENQSGWREGGGGFSNLHYDIRPDLSGYETGLMQCMGDFYRAGCATWAIMIGGSETPGDSMQFEVLFEKDATDDLVPGRYPVMPDFTQGSFLPDWTIIGHMQGPYPAGTWYMEFDEKGQDISHAPANSGSLEISKEGDLYTLTFDFEDDSTEPFKITGTWTGRLENVKATSTGALVR